MSRIISISLLLIISLHTAIEKMSPENVKLAINCGGNQYRDQNGILYEEDNYYDQGNPSDHGINYEISNTRDQILYQTERWSSSTLTYSLPLSEPGKYTLVLKFSEVFFENPNQKVFDVSLGSKTVIKNLDIYREVGKAAALDEYVEFELRGEKVYVQGSEAKNAYDKNKLIVKFIKGTRDNPKINAILLVKGTKANTDYAEKQKVMSETRKKEIDAERKKMTMDLRHDSDEDYPESVLIDSDVSELKIKEDSVFSIINSTPGYAIIASIILFFVLNFVIDFIN